jgi:hypothetical protein
MKQPRQRLTDNLMYQCLLPSADCLASFPNT